MIDWQHCCTKNWNGSGPDVTDEKNIAGDLNEAASPQVLAGTGILRATVLGTAAFVLLGLAASIFQGALTGAYVALSLFEFFVGMIVFVLAFFRAIDRSRTEAIGIGGLFFASGSAPKRVQVILMVSLTVQVVVSIIVASLHLYTGLAFGVLAPMWALGFTGLWVAAYGTFPEREPELSRTGRRDEARRLHKQSAPKKPADDAE
ncbi:unannotated protein [freshwater metagenome]|uniref:Unannotated protein n=1 Tax=freshwater metagenome TaxID=449393 RepID=A0A6J6FXR0_9ZZZZ